MCREDLDETIQLSSCCPINKENNLRGIIRRINSTLIAASSDQYIIIIIAGWNTKIYN